ncbi:DNA polymerase III subunit gamma/tau, partial [Candidatus Peregrinibacteria bacterium]|nr:DNA polymerase III subunit gamma/tau [Candidatus Peregrinibacteria bacterium]
MEKIALYRKYRPHDFDNLIGQDHIKNTLINALKSSHVSHAYLFSGPRGTGKTSTARLIAKALNCKKLKEKYNPCGQCEFCKDINDGKLIDLIEIDAASNRGIDEVRDLREKINFAPTRATYKVYIIDEVHMMTKEAFNALLKTLEEPPPHAYFILATTEIHKIPDTIISRCQRFDFKRISENALLDRLKFIVQSEKVDAEKKALEAVTRYVDGGLRDAIGLIEQLTADNKLTFDHVHDVLGISDYDLIEDLYKNLDAGDSKSAFKIIYDLHDQGSDLKKFTFEFINHLRNKLLASINERKNNEIAKLINMIEVFQEAQTKLHTMTIPQLPLEIAVIKIVGLFSEPEKNNIKKNKKPEKETKSEIREHKSIEEIPSNSSTSSKSSNLSFNATSLKENWPRIIERVKSPSLRMSLKNAVPVKVSAPEVTLQFNTKFHKDKVMEHDHRIELEAIIKELTGKPAKILSVLKELEIKPVVDESDTKDNIVDEALDIF